MDLLKITSPYLFILLLSSCQLEDPREGISADEVIRLSSTAASAPADSLSTIGLTAELLDKSAPNLVIEFRTSYGHFVNVDEDTPRRITVTASGRKAQVTLQMGNKPTKDFLVSAEVISPTAEGERFTAELTLTTERALPEILQLTTDRQLIAPNAGSEARLTVRLFRNEGVVSHETLVAFSQIPLNNSLAELTLTDFDFTNGDRLTTSIRSNNQEEGQVMVIARTEGAGGEILADSLLITVRE